MNAATRNCGSGRQIYDYRFRQAIWETGDPDLFGNYVKPATAKSWIRRGCPDVLMLDEDHDDTIELRKQIVQLERKVQQYCSIVGRLVAFVRILRAERQALDFSLGRARLPDGEEKKRILVAIARALTFVPLAIVLHILNLSASRYHSWVKADSNECALDDRSSCAKLSPTKITPPELAKMKEMAEAEEYRHMPTSVLAVFAQRIGAVFVSASTWCQFARERNWRRPSKRKYPAKPKVGVRATKANEIWHIDVSVLRLLDGTKVLIHGIIDNFSRRILAWRICGKLDPTTTVELLREAAKNSSIKPLLYCDKGGENVNDEVDELVSDGVISRVVAQIEIRFSNSIIEMFWRSLKHNWLYLNELDTFTKVKRLVDFYIAQHNTEMPHSSHKGQTPDEVYFGRGDQIPDKLAAARVKARVQRMVANRAMSCHVCDPESGVNSPRLQLQSAKS